MKRQKKRCAQCSEVMPPARTDAKYCSEACGVAYRRSVRKESNPELRAAVGEVRRLVKAGELPDEYGTSIDGLQELRPDIAELPAQLVSAIEGICVVASVHGLQDPEAAELVAKTVENARLVARNLMWVARRIQELASEAGAAYADGQLGDELNAALYPAQVDHWWAEGPDVDDDEGAEV